ncbi:hypothetical protein D7W82_22525 [Corallococcus sp. CA049B]|nr:hypothetical protein D7W82_22525 [Corallococcus sp. CA049B]
MTALELFRMRSVASAMRARAAHVEVREADGALHATVLGGDEEVPRTTWPMLQVLEGRFCISSARAALAAQTHDAADVLVTQRPNFG